MKIGEEEVRTEVLETQGLRWDETKAAPKAFELNFASSLAMPIFILHSPG